MSDRHSDDLFRFSYRVFKIEYIIIKLVLLALSLYGLYKLVQVEFGIGAHAAPQIQSEGSKIKSP